MISSSTAQLARLGGPKTRTKPMPGRHAFGDEELAAVQEVFRHYHEIGVDFGYQGAFEARYCVAFVRYPESPGYADAVATGTAALIVAVAGLPPPRRTPVLATPIDCPAPISPLI